MDHLMDACLKISNDHCLEMCGGDPIEDRKPFGKLTD